MDKKIKDLIDTTINNNSLVKVNDKLYLKRYQIEVLDYYHIDYKTSSSVSELLFKINDVLENDEVDDYDNLAEVADSLQEFNYYHNTNK
jgi:oligoribonuclease (3'-5' exoribonuclease)